MRIARIKPPEERRQTAYYHCVSRIVNRSFVIQDEEKEFLVKWMRKYERMCGVRVVTFCIMSNHIHLLLEVPPRPEETLGDEELLERLSFASRKVTVVETKQLLDRLKADGKTEEAEQMRNRIQSRMWDVSMFMSSNSNSPSGSTRSTGDAGHSGRTVSRVCWWRAADWRWRRWRPIST